MAKPLVLAPLNVDTKILEIRSERVMLDRDLAAVYGVTTGALRRSSAIEIGSRMILFFI